jgi:hypothetical protein
MKKLLFATALAAAAVFPTSAFAGTFSGVVVGKGGGNLAVAAKGGLVRTVHSSAQVRVGARVKVNGAQVRVVGVAHRARIHGVVVRRLRGTTFLAAGRSLIAVRSTSGRRLAAVAAGPSSGAVVNANVAISGGQLTQQSMQVVGHDNTVTIQAPVTAVGPGTVTVTVNGQPLTIQLPAGIQLPASLVGQSITLNVRLALQDDEEQGDNNDSNDGDENDNDDGDEDDHHGPGGGDDD